jgi:hypothetical protein
MKNFIVWDRIGDVLYLRLESQIKGKIYFLEIDKLKKRNMKIQIVKTLNFLINFRENEFKEFNKIRVDVVHYKSI